MANAARWLTWRASNCACPPVASPESAGTFERVVAGGGAGEAIAVGASENSHVQRRQVAPVRNTNGLCTYASQHTIFGWTRQY